MTPTHPEGCARADVPSDVPVRRAVPPHAHAALRAERIRVAHWRRLVRARMDLAAAAVAVPEAIGEHVADALPDGADDGLPAHVCLVDAVSAGGPEGEIDRLEALRGLDRRLARYELVVTQQLRATGVDVPARSAAANREPGGHRPGPGPMGQTVPRT